MGSVIAKARLAIASRFPADMGPTVDACPAHAFAVDEGPDLLARVVVQPSKEPQSAAPIYLADRRRRDQRRRSWVECRRAERVIDIGELDLNRPAPQSFGLTWKEKR